MLSCCLPPICHSLVGILQLLIGRGGPRLILVAAAFFPASPPRRWALVGSDKHPAWFSDVCRPLAGPLYILGS